MGDGSGAYYEGMMESEEIREVFRALLYERETCHRIAENFRDADGRDLWRGKNPEDAYIAGVRHAAEGIARRIIRQDLED